jgi:hypothetical protein
MIVGGLMDHIGRVEVELECPPRPGGDDAVVGVDEDAVTVKRKAFMAATWSGSGPLEAQGPPELAHRPVVAGGSRL